MEYFAGLDVSMAETHVCVMNRDGVVMHEAQGAIYACRYCDRAGASTGLSADRVRDGGDGADALPRFEPAWTTHRLQREPTARR